MSQKQEQRQEPPECREPPEGWKEETEQIAFRSDFCRITKQSPDKNLVGRVGYVVSKDPVQVRLEGIPDPIPIEKKHLEYLPSKHAFFVCTIFRHHLKEYDNFYTTILGHEEESGQVRWMGIQNVSNRAKTLCCMLMLTVYLPTITGPCVFMLPDLNVSIALNKWCAGQRNVRLDDSCQKYFLELTKVLKEHEHKVFFYYEPYYLKPNDEIDLAQQRVEAVKRGLFSIYPSPVRLGTLEAMYAGSTEIRQEQLSQHGYHEVDHYVQNAILLNDTMRLVPTVLAQVDPNNFWEATHNIKTMLKSLQQHMRGQQDKELLLEAWNEIQEGCHQSADYLDQSMIGYEIDTFQDLRADDEGIWKKGVFGPQGTHERITWKLAKLAVCVCNKMEGTRLPITLLEYYKGTELAKMARELNQEENLMSAAVLERRYTAESAQKLDQFEQMMGIRGLADTTKCGSCGVQDKKLQVCGKCKGAAYCSRDCQIKDWKEGGHKKACKALRLMLAAAEK